MKKIFALALTFAIFGFAKGQVIPTANTAPSSVSGVHPVPSAYDASTKVNFVRTWYATKPFTADTSITSSLRTIQEVKQASKYIDGLGRPIQLVLKQITPSGKDIVAPSVYDEYGREQYQYLPYAVIDSNTSSGKFRRNPFNEQASFLSNATYNPGLSGEQVYYNKTVFEPSPLNRVDTAFLAGNSWGGSHVGKVISHQINTLADSVRIWAINTAIGSTPTSTAYYAAGELYKNVLIDEHGKQSVEYLNKDLKLILKKAQLDVSPSTHHSGWLCTYYVYDGFDQLRYVIQPKGVELRAANWALSSDILSELCFRYEYDERGRNIIKKMPGVGEVWLVYDARDRVVMTQDSSLRVLGQWMVNQYDFLDREVRSYLWTNGSSRSTHQSSAALSISYPTLSGTYDLLTETYYDDYSWVSGSGSGLNSTLITTYTSNTNYFLSASNFTFPYPQPITASYTTAGMVTGTKVKVLGTSTYLYTVKFYDDRSRMIQSQATNYTGGKDTVTLQYGFTGNLLRTLVGHSKGGSNSQSHKISTKYDSDAGGRLIKISKKTGNSPETIIAEKTYDELSQLKKTKLGQNRYSEDPTVYLNTAIDSLEYTFNIQGWLKSINKDYARGTGSDHYFGMELAYDYGFTDAQLNGNIAGIRWRSRGDNEQRAYGYSYDAVNRFTRANFTQYTSGSWNTTAGVDFTTRSLSYDGNGNILSMTQKGWTLGGVTTIDSLVYGYNSSSNKLNYVTDKANNANSKLDDFKEITNNTSQDYIYDGNASLKNDKNKGISAIFYNHLNLPDSIRITGKGTIKYTYDAVGNKLRKRVFDSTWSFAQQGFATTTDYVGPFVYERDTLQVITHEEGRIRLKDNLFVYDYFIKDHLRNTRVILTDELRTDMYPSATMENVTDVSSIDDPDNYVPYYSNTDYTDDADCRYPISEIEDYPSYEGQTDPNNYVAKVGGEKTIGPGITLKVMAGDKFNVRVLSWYKMDNRSPDDPTTVLGNLALALANGIEKTGGSKYSATEILERETLDPGLTGFFASQSVYDDLKPKAFLNWVLFDERYNYVSSSSGFDQVGNDEELENHHFTDMPIDKNGYLYIYVSNETPNIDVFFDNLQVTHIRGPLLEETHYYAFGGPLVGISTKALGYGNPQNRYLYNGKEKQLNDFKDGTGIGWMDYSARMYDPQIGRWHGIDQMADLMENWSPYSYVYNNPVRYIDPDGMTPDDPVKYYATADAAAFAFAAIYGPTSLADRNREYSGLIYKVKIEGKEYFAHTPGEKHPNNDVRDNYIASPGPKDQVLRRHIPAGAEVVSYIHLHPYGKANNESWSSADNDLIRKNGGLSFYLLNSIGELRIRTVEENGKDVTIVTGIYQFTDTGIPADATNVFDGPAAPARVGGEIEIPYTSPKGPGPHLDPDHRRKPEVGNQYIPKKPKGPEHPGSAGKQGGFDPNKRTHVKDK